MFWRCVKSPKLYSSVNSVLFGRIYVYTPGYGLRLNFHNYCKKSVSNCNILYKRNVIFRSFHEGKQPKSDRTVHKSTVYYASALLVVTLGCTYAAVPLYRIFCQAFSYGGTTAEADRTIDMSKMEKRKKREITILFNADVNASLNWNFNPQQRQMKVNPGETALAFYTAENRLDRPVIGVSTYNVVPFDAGQYFNKIQCFCFEEQMLNPHEQVDMPVFFYIDPEFADDPKMELVDEIILSYTFFEVKEGVELPKPSYYAPHKK